MAALCLLKLLPLATAEGTDKASWPFAISPTGEPVITAVLARFGEADFITVLMLKHELRDNGHHYVSHIAIPELESHFVSIGDGIFEWSRFDGQRCHMAPLRLSRVDTRYWLMKDFGNQCYQIASTDGRETYQYAHCMPVAAIWNGRRYSWQYADGRLVSIQRLTPSYCELVHIDYPNDNTFLLLSAAGKCWQLRFNPNGAMIACIETGSNKTILSFAYQNDLLRQINYHDRQQCFRFVWGLPHFPYWWQPIHHVPPIVVYDGTTAYRATIGLDRVTFHYHQANGQTGSWEVWADWQ